MARFDYGDLVTIKSTVRTWIEVPGVGLHKGPRPGESASVYYIETDRILSPLPQFPPGIIYGVEFDDGGAVEVHEDDLEFVTAQP
jgi:hypothetical protein